jgi:hypothetical protein
MIFAKVYTQAVTTTAALADADIVGSATVKQVAYLTHIKVSGAGARTAGSLTIETQAGTVLHEVEVTAATTLNLHEEFGTPIKSLNGLQLNADGTVTGPIRVSVGYIG